MNTAKEIQKHAERIQIIAADYGLDFFKTIFELIDYDQMNEIAAKGGFPVRYTHWRFGMSYEYLKKSYSYGLSKIYEMVINNDPCYAYLLKGNLMVDQKLVIAHVYGHCDFFKNNQWFAHTNRKMVDRIANNASRIRSYYDRYGIDRVENFIDTCLSLENLIDYHAPFMKRNSPKLQERETPKTVKKLKSSSYMDSYINPKSYLESERVRLDTEFQREKRTPETPQKDALKFLLDHAPLEDWESEILSIVREEAYYFSPQGQTKIMNEGWASYWHSTMMTRNILTDAEVIDYADHHSGTMGTSPGQINPYKLGIELFRDIEERWNKGKFGKDYDDCDDLTEKKYWNKNLGLGRKKIFEVRRNYNDITFIDEFLNEEFCHNQKLFTYGYNKRTGRYEILDRDYRKVKRQLLFSLTNFGQPFIYVSDANYENRGELLLQHRHEGFDLKMDYAKEVLKNIATLWKRPVNLETFINGYKKLLIFDGKEFREKELS